MNRRDFITCLGGAAAWPLTAHAQQADRVWRIGALMGYAESDPEAQTNVAAFREGLQKLGWTEGHKIRMDTRWVPPFSARRWPWTECDLRGRTAGHLSRSDRTPRCPTG